MRSVISSVFRSSRAKNHRSRRHLTLWLVLLILGAAVVLPSVLPGARDESTKSWAGGDRRAGSGKGARQKQGTKSVADALNQEGRLKLESIRRFDVSSPRSETLEAELFVNPSALPQRAVTATSSATRRATPNNENGRADPRVMQEGNLQSNEQTVQARGDEDKVSRNPKEERLTKAHSFNGDLRDLPHRKPVKRERPEREEPAHSPTFYPGTPAAPVTNEAAAPSAPTLNAPAPPTIMNFDGLDFANWGAGHPPDTNGDVGPTYYIQTVNTSIGIFRKSDGVRVAAFTFNTFMSQGHFGNLCDTNNFGDPVVLYDSFEDRWIITDFAFTLDGSNNVVNPPGSLQCFAASQTGDPVSGGWNFYSINTTGGLGDYPKFGIWPDGLYMSVNMFNYPAGGAFQNSRVYAFNKAQMYAGAPAVQSVSFNAPAIDFTILPSNARLQTGTPPAGTPNYFVSTSEFLNGLTVYKFHVDWNRISTSTFAGPDVPIAATSWPNATVPNAPSLGGNALDVLSIRAMMQNQYTNIDGAESLWTTHTVRRGNTSGFAAPRWYQVNVTGGSVAANLPQAATWDPDGANVIYRFLPSLAVDRMGDMALGYSTSDATTKPAIKYAGRLATDPINTLGQTEQLLIQGAGTQTGNCGQTPCIRWGDYSAMSLDPDGCTFWYANEYYAVDGLNDLTRIGSFSFSQCTPVGAGGTVSGTVTDSATSNPINGASVTLGSRTTTTDPSGFYTFSDLPAGTYPSITASFAGYGSSTATSIVVTDGGTTTQNFSLTIAVISACPVDTSQTDFQTGVPTNVDLTTSPGDVILSNPSNIDQQNTTISGSGVGITITNWGGETFTAGVTGQLTRADINLFCSTCTGTFPNLTLSLRNTSANLPAGADVASATVTGSNSGAGVYYTAVFASPPTLVAGTVYALVVRPTANPSAGTYAITRSSTNVYAGGQRVNSADSGSTWTAPLTAGQTTDAGFKTYINTGFALSGNQISGLKDANPAVGSVPRWLTLSWTATTPANTTIQFQAAASNSSNGPFNFVGPDGTASSFFTTSGASLCQFNGFRYLKYEALLSTTDSTMTPTLNDVTVCFDNNAQAIPTITPGGPTTFCSGGSVNLTSSSASGNQWHLDGNPIGGATNQTYSATASGDYTVTDTSSGCSSAPSTATTVTVNPIPATPTITPGGPTTFCNGNSVTLTSSSASGNQWYLNSNPIGGATNQGYIATAAGDYSVTVTASGCTSSPSTATMVTVNPIPATPTITPGGPTTFCAGGSVTLTSSSASGNQWFLNGNPIGGATNQGYIATAAGNYSVTVTSSGCTSSPSTATMVTVNPIPATPTITPGGPTTFFAGGSVTLTSSSTTGNQWYLNNNPIGGATNQSYIATASGDYTVTVTSSGCTSTPSAAVTVTVKPFVAFPPTISKLFLPDTVASNGTTLLSFAISNPNSDPNTNVTLTGITFSDNLPAGLVIASPNELSSDCGGTTTAIPGSSSISLSGGTLAPAAPAFRAGQLRTQASVNPAQGACFISVKVKAPSALGTLNNTTGPIASNESGPGATSNTASLTVTAPTVPPTIAKGFGAASIPLNGSTSLAFTFTNPNSNVTLINVSASDTLPAGLVVANPNSLAGSCSADISANPGSNTVGITALNLPASSSCSFSINVTGTSAGTWNNTSGNVTATYDDGTGNFAPIIGGTATATIQVLKGNQTITFDVLTNKTFGDADFSVSATASSGLSVSFTATGNCTVTSPSPGTVHLTGAGSCTITASQAGDTNFNAAADVPQSFTIANSALIALSQSNYAVNEDTGFVTITVNRTGDLSVPFTVNYATDDTGSSDVCSTLNSGMASARCGFSLTLGTLRFAAAETQKTFMIPIDQDSYSEGPEMFTVNLSNLTGTGVAFASPSSATVTISDSAAPAPNAIDDPGAFVREQYHDFLNREPDAAGLAFWTNEITSCGNDAVCRDNKRIAVSAAFFLSIEFQTTGNLVRSFYVATLDRPLTNNMPGFAEFERDTEALQRGLVVGQGNWQQTLNDNRDAFMRDFVTRGEFIGLYPTTDTPVQYVDKLYLHAGITPTSTERSNAIAEFGSATTAADAGGRGRALIDVTQNATFQQREINRSFVQMEYFGYLRRNPNDAPDGNFAGYDFWVNKLNAAGGNFIEADMVKAFITSGEYRRRFGP